MSASRETIALIDAEPVIEFYRPHGSDDHAVSRCGRYLIQWYDSTVGRFYNAYFLPPSPATRRNIYQGKSDDDAKAHCRSHAKFNQPQPSAASTHQQKGKPR